jgi:Ca2+/H+ antiporter
MSIQDIYYLISIISTVIFIGVLIFIGFTIWKIYTSISNLEKYVKHDLIDKTASFVNSQKGEIASLVGVGVGSFLLRRVKDMIFRR